MGNKEIIEKEIEKEEKSMLREFPDYEEFKMNLSFFFQKLGGTDLPVKIIELKGKLEGYNLAKKDFLKVIDDKITHMEGLMKDKSLKMHKNTEVAIKLRHYKELKKEILGE